MPQHTSSTFINSCLKVPRDPITKMPVAHYERKTSRNTAMHRNRLSIDSASTDDSLQKSVTNPKIVRDFYESIPDYQDLHDLPEDQFLLTLKSLRQKKREMLGISTEDLINHSIDSLLITKDEEKLDQNHIIPYRAPTPFPQRRIKDTKCSDTGRTTSTTSHIRRKQSVTLTHEKEKLNKKLDLDSNNAEAKTSSAIKLDKVEVVPNHNYKRDNKEKSNSNEVLKDTVDRTESRNRANPSACSITWSDKYTTAGNIDAQFDRFFGQRSISSVSKERNCHSLPTSPIRRRVSQSWGYSNGFTIPKPFKMTKRDEDKRAYNKLTTLAKSFSDEMLHRKIEKKKSFRAKPVPIESRIPLYDRILQDQAMRRAISKINSLAELQARMKPFSFTEREERQQKSRASIAPSSTTSTSDKTKKKKKFKARPVPKNLFSNYVYDKMKEDTFYRSMNKRIRSEELLRQSSVPGNMASRSRSRMSTPAAHSDLPTDTNSDLGSDMLRTGSKTDFITTTPQPFALKTASRASRRNTRKQSNVNEKVEPSEREARPLSALDVRSVNRSNLAAVLRIENTKRKLEEELSRRIVEQRYKAEQRWRDHVLRKKPAWKLVRNDYEEDIALRLQTRREEERLRREEFLHEMELMHSRVRQQPMLFERYYTPISHSSDSGSLHVSPSKVKLHKKSPKKVPKDFQRKVSINDIAETINDNFFDYLNKEVGENFYSGSEFVVESFENDCK